MTLPTQTDFEDAQKVCAFLRTKATGSSEKDAKAVVGAKFLDVRKIASYEAWGVVEKKGDVLTVTPVGRELGQAQDDVSKRAVAGRMLARVNAYRMALDYLRNNALPSISAPDIGAWWHQHLPDELGTTAEKSIASAANAFFSVTAAAGGGKHVGGSNHGPARLDLIDIQRIAEILDTTIQPAIQSSETISSDQPVGTVESVVAAQVTPEAGSRDVPAPETVLPAFVTENRVFIAHGRDLALVEQVRSALDVAGLKYEVAEDEEATAIPVPEKVLDAMRRCNAAVICVTSEAATGGDHKVNENVLIEIGAAFVLYDRRVVLVWDKSLPVPSNLQGLYRCELDGDVLTWENGMKLLKAVKNFTGVPA